MTFAADFDRGKVEMRVSTADEDRHEGIDAWIQGLPVAARRRWPPYPEDAEGRPIDITLRSWRASGADTDLQKVQDGRCRALIWIFEFEGHVIVVSTAALKRAIEDGECESSIRNKDNTTAFTPIRLDRIPHLTYRKRQ